MSANLVQIIVALSKGVLNPASTAVQTNCVVTDSGGIPQAAVILTGSESPTAWAFQTSVAPGGGSVTATDQDASGNTVGSPVTQAFTEVGTGGPGFAPTTGITVTPATAAQIAARPSTQGRRF